MAHVFICNICGYHYESLDKILGGVSFEKRERIAKFRNKEDIIRSALGEKLLKYALREKYGINTIKIKYSKNGKPYLENADIFFNISHSKDMIVVILDNSEVGVDIEKIEDIEIEEISSFFCLEERMEILSAANKKITFYKLWTLKESYIKMLGLGLNKELNSFCVWNEGNKSRVYEIDKQTNCEYCSECILLREDYVLTYFANTEVNVVDVKWSEIDCD